MPDKRKKRFKHKEKGAIKPLGPKHWVATSSQEEGRANVLTYGNALYNIHTRLAAEGYLLENTEGQVRWNIFKVAPGCEGGPLDG